MSDSTGNQLTGAEAFVRTLQAHRVEYIFGLCGDTSLPFYDALYRLDHGMTHILSRDERSAAYMADGYARVTGKVGICEGPSGGGATYILPGLVEAGESSIPILAVTTDVAVGSRGRFTLTELDQAALFRPVTKWNTVIDSAAKVPETVRAAFRHMSTGRPGSAHIGLPFDVQKGAVDEADVWGDPSLGQFPARRMGPDPEAVEAAAEIIAAAAMPVFVCGGGPVIAGAWEELRAVAELLQAPVCTTISGKGSIAENHPLAVGVVGSNGGTAPTRAIVDAADVVVFVGCRAGSVTTERWRHPARGTARIVHLDSDPSVIGTNYQTDAAVAGDARLSLAALFEALRRRVKTAPSRRITPASIAAAKHEKWARTRECLADPRAPIPPEILVATLQEVLPPDAVVVADPGTPCPYLSAYLRQDRPGRQYITNRAHGALGYALAASIGAHFGRPSVKTVCVMGDGSFGFTSGELETVTRLDLPITFIVVSNSVFGWIKAGQKSGFGQRYFSVDFSTTDHAKVAAAYGLKTWRVTEPGDLRGALAAALEAGGPTLVDVVSQPLHEATAPVSEWVA